MNLSLTRFFAGLLATASYLRAVSNRPKFVFILTGININHLGDENHSDMCGTDDQDIYMRSMELMPQVQEHLVSRRLALQDITAPVRNICSPLSTQCSTMMASFYLETANPLDLTNNTPGSRDLLP